MKSIQFLSYANFGWNLKQKFAFVQYYSILNSTPAGPNIPSDVWWSSSVSCMFAEHMVIPDSNLNSQWIQQQRIELAWKTLKSCTGLNTVGGWSRAPHTTPAAIHRRLIQLFCLSLFDSIPNGRCTCCDNVNQSMIHA